MVPATTASAAISAAPASSATSRRLAIHAPPLAPRPARLDIRLLQKLAGDGEDGLGLQAPGDAGKIDSHLGSSLSTADLGASGGDSYIARQGLEAVDRSSGVIAQSSKTP